MTPGRLVTKGKGAVAGAGAGAGTEAGAGADASPVFWYPYLGWIYDHFALFPLNSRLILFILQIRFQYHGCVFQTDTFSNRWFCLLQSGWGVGGFGGLGFLHYWYFYYVFKAHVFWGVHFDWVYSNCTVYRTRLVFTLQLTELSVLSRTLFQFPPYLPRYPLFTKCLMAEILSLVLLKAETLSLARNVIDREGQKWNRFSLKYLFESRNLFLLLQRYPLFSWTC